MRKLLVLSLLLTTFAASADERPAAHWEPVPHFTNKRPGRKIDMVVIHTVEGSASSCVATFRNSPRHVSAHYIVAKDGSITQCVKDEDVAWHAGSVNDRSIGIEHEGFSARRDTWTDASYAASARLTRWLCDTYSIPIDRKHIVGHVETPGSPHGDPGPHFDWDRYMKLVRGEGPTGVAPVASSSDISRPDDAGLPLPTPERTRRIPPQQGTAPSASKAPDVASVSSAAESGRASTGMAQALARSGDAKGDAPKGFGADGLPLLARGSHGPEVLELQKKLNEDAKACVLAEDGIFGPETEKAVREFQEKHGCKVDGIVGPETRGALARIE